MEWAGSLHPVVIVGFHTKRLMPVLIPKKAAVKIEQSLLLELCLRPGNDHDVNDYSLSKHRTLFTYPHYAFAADPGSSGLTELLS